MLRSFAVARIAGSGDATGKLWSIYEGGVLLPWDHGSITLDFPDLSRCVLEIRGYVLFLSCNKRN